MKKVLFITNIPTPYRVDFFNELGKLVDLTVLFEAKTTPVTTFNYNLDSVKYFRAVFLSDEPIRERRVDWKILPFLKRGAYDHIVVTSYGYATEAAAILALKARKIPYEMELDGGIARRENPIVRAVKSMLIRGAARYWSTGAQTDAFFRGFGVGQEMIRRYPFSSILEREIVQRPPNREERRAAKEKLGIPEKNLVLSIGQMLHRKGYDLLIRAAAYLPPETRVVIVGGTPREEWRALMREIKTTNVSFVDFCAKDALSEYFCAADVFVLPTREDVWGLVINEAMAKGVPVVTTDGCVAGCEMIRNGENGYRIPVDDWESISGYVNRLLNDEEHRLSVAAEGLKTVRGYTVEAMARAHAEIFNQE